MYLTAHVFSHRHSIGRMSAIPDIFSQRGWLSKIQNLKYSFCAWVSLSD